MADPTSSDALTSPLFLRNRDPILAVLTRVVPEGGTVLEIAGGSGEHAISFAGGLRSGTCLVLPRRIGSGLVESFRLRCSLPSRVSVFTQEAGIAVI
jgi:hypothetical protein